MHPTSAHFLLLLLLPLIINANGDDDDDDSQTLLLLKSQIDPANSLLNWAPPLSTNWTGIRELNPGSRVTKLVLESLNLAGTLAPQTLAPLDQIRVLSFKSNSLSGPIPDLSPLRNLKSLYLNSNRFSGRIPPSLSTIHRLKIVALSDNQLSGEIPASFEQIPRLYALLLQNNRLSGQIPSFGQDGLRFFNVSNNTDLSGWIPETRTLSRFNMSCFLNLPNLCGDQIRKPCSHKPIFPPSTPAQSTMPMSTSYYNHHKNNNNNNRRLLKIIASAVSAFVFLGIVLLLIIALLIRKKNEESNGVGDKTRAEEEEEATATTTTTTATTTTTSAVKRDFSWENEGLGKLVFCGGGVGEMYSLEDLLKASAETLGRGTVGSTYKAVMESGFIVTVKRLKDTGGLGLGVEEFRRRMEELGRLSHPNVVPLRAYFQAKDERLLVYDYFPNGSLFSLIHGSRPSGTGKPLHWTSCLKIAEDVATGLLYLHQSNTVHSNLKSSNVLLGSDFESCLTDYGLLPILNSCDDSNSSTSSSAIFYRAPECRTPRPTFTPQSDIYSFGVLLLELLTGKTPFQDLVEEHRADIPKWVRSTRDEEMESGGDDSSSEDKLVVLLNIAMACIVGDLEKRPVSKEVARMIKEARAEVAAVVSSNSSEHSPGRWSDTVQSLPREYGSEHSVFAERD